MNCIREAENYLRYYHELHQSIKHASRMISRLKMQTAPGEVSAVSIDITGIRASKPVNTLNQMYQLQQWQEMQARTLEEIEKIEEALAGISQAQGCERYRDVLFMWYVECLSQEEIGERIGYTARHVRRLKRSAINKFAVSLFGIVALKAI
jgi:RNA polymerase sigma factor (sigma-70 family)